MSKLKQIPIGKQILFAFGALCLVLAMIGALFFFSLREIERSSQERLSYVVDESELVAAAAQNVGLIQAVIFRHVLASDPKEIELHDQTIHEIDKANAEKLAAYQKFVDTKEEEQLYAKVLQSRKVYMERTEELLVLSRANRDTEAGEFAVSKQVPAYGEYQKAIEDMTSYVENEVRDISGVLTNRIARIRMIGDIFVGIAVLIAIGTGFAVTGVARRLKEDNRILQTEIAERKRAETAVRESEERFKQLASTLNDVFWMTTPDMKEILYVSPAYEKLWGRSLESLRKNPLEWLDAIHPEDRDRVAQTFAKLGSEKANVTVEYRVVRPDGTIRWMADRGFQVRNEAGEVYRTVGIVSDITDRKKADEALRLSEERFREMAENINEVFWMSDPATSRILYVSPAYERIWGRTCQSLYDEPMSFVDGIHPDDREGMMQALKKQAVEGTFQHEYRVVRPDGSVRWIWDHSFPVRNEAGKLVRVVGIAQDNTERKRLADQLVQSQKMETVGKLAGGIAHEFNSIMTAIIGQSELILSDLPSGNPLSKNAEEIRKAADRAATLTRQLLAYGRKQIFQPEILDLNNVLSNMDGVLQNLMGAGVDVRIVPTMGLKLVKADAGQIEQVIMNMAINARDAMPNGGKLTLETSNVTLSQESVGRHVELKPGDYVMLAITDTGTGMSEEVKKRLFEPFFSTKGVGKGTGLGLATCYGIVKQSGGHINAYSEPGKGTTFKVYLPQIEQQKEVPSEPRAPSNLPHGTETILLVEDDPALREMAGMLLQRLGYSVLAAANGMNALGLVEQRGKQAIDLLFTDVVMPQMDGKQLSDRIRALHPETRILFTSAYTENAIVHQGVLDPGVALLQKPFTPSALAHKVREILDG